MTDEEKDDLRCDVLLFIATPTEKKKLKKIAREAGFQFATRTVEELGEYFFMGTIGRTKVNAVRTEMGPFSYGGSASRAINFRIATGATAIIQLGMAFGVDPGPDRQSYGDVLVSTSIIPYDLREVRPEGTVGEVLPADIVDQPGDAGDYAAATVEVPNMPPPFPVAQPPIGGTPVAERPYRVDYKDAVRHASKESLLKMFVAERDRGDYGHRIHFGGLLSGGARIFSRSFLGELMRGVPQAEDGIIGGEMEAVGLLSVSPKDDPIWIVVKGISDFADENRDDVINKTRPIACENSVRLVLAALANA